MKPQRFRTSVDLRAWLEANHASCGEIWLRLRKAGAAGPGVTYAEALDLALCFGWIDGVRRSLDEHSFVVRFTPRKLKSVWSKLNLQHYARLDKLSLIAPAGRAAYERRDPTRSGVYSFESLPREFSPAYRSLFQHTPGAWEFFSSQPPSYRRTCTFWVLSAKREPTRLRRLAQLISDSAAGRPIGLLARPEEREPSD